MIGLIKKALGSRYAPNFLYSLWFSRFAAEKLADFKAKLNSAGGLLDHLPQDQQEYWKQRIDLVLAAPDNAAIPRVATAGQLVDDMLVLHNGVQIDPLSYYSFPLLKMLIDNKGVHEPQEEKIFQEVLQSMRKQENTDSRPRQMLELGAYWSFYSMWFKQVFPDANCVMVEPNRKNLFYGKQNFKLNNLEGAFIHAGIGKDLDSKHNITSVDEICQQQKITFLDILHSDIQGYELEMLHGSKRMLSEDRVGYVFVSTHSNELHENCRALLQDQYKFELVASADLDQSYSWDGILVMKAPNYTGIDTVEITNR